MCVYDSQETKCIKRCPTKEEMQPKKVAGSFRKGKQTNKTKLQVYNRHFIAKDQQAKNHP